MPAVSAMTVCCLSSQDLEQTDQMANDVFNMSSTLPPDTILGEEALKNELSTLLSYCQVMTLAGYPSTRAGSGRSFVPFNICRVRTKRKRCHDSQMSSHLSSPKASASTSACTIQT